MNNEFKMMCKAACCPDLPAAYFIYSAVSRMPHEMEMVSRESVIA
jgi:hypothetical protein